MEKGVKRGHKLKQMILFLIVSYLLTGILLLLLAYLLYQFRISDKVLAAGITLTYILSTFFTGLLAGKTKGRKKYLWGLCLGGCYFAVLLLVSFILKKNPGQLSANLPLTMVLCMASGMLGGMLG